MTDKMSPSEIRKWVQVRIDRGGFVPGLSVCCSGGSVFLRIPPGVPKGNRHERKVTTSWTLMRLKGARLAELAATLADFDLKMLADFNAIKPAFDLKEGDATAHWGVVGPAVDFDPDPGMIVVAVQDRTVEGSYARHFPKDQLIQLEVCNGKQVFKKAS